MTMRTAMIIASVMAALVLIPAGLNAWSSGGWRVGQAPLSYGVLCAIAGGQVQEIGPFAYHCHITPKGN